MTQWPCLCPGWLEGSVTIFTAQSQRVPNMAPHLSRLHFSSILHLTGLQPNLAVLSLRVHVTYSTLLRGSMYDMHSSLHLRMNLYGKSTVGKYASPMDALGRIVILFITFSFRFGFMSSVKLVISACKKWGLLYVPLKTPQKKKGAHSKLWKNRHQKDETILVPSYSAQVDLPAINRSRLWKIESLKDEFQPTGVYAFFFIMYKIHREEKSHILKVCQKGSDYRNMLYNYIYIHIHIL